MLCPCPSQTHISLWHQPPQDTHICAHRISSGFLGPYKDPCWLNRSPWGRCPALHMGVVAFDRGEMDLERSTWVLPKEANLDAVLQGTVKSTLKKPWSTCLSHALSQYQSRSQCRGLQSASDDSDHVNPHRQRKGGSLFLTPECGFAVPAHHRTKSLALGVFFQVAIFLPGEGPSPFVYPGCSFQNILLEDR